MRCGCRAHVVVILIAELVTNGERGAERAG
jgi:hypothetical protein